MTRLIAHTYGASTGLAGYRRDHVGVRRVYTVTLDWHDGERSIVEVEAISPDEAKLWAKARLAGGRTCLAESVEAA